MSSGDENGQEGVEEGYPLHALEYFWDEFEPQLICFDTGEGEVSEFDIEDVKFAVSRRKKCVGYWDEGGGHVPCPKNALVTRFNQCQECSGESFLPDQDCVFEPKCDGVEPTKCDGDESVREFCSREHALYVAFYDTRMKIGMSSARRIEKRLIEQGADAYAVIGRFHGRRRARSAEKMISGRLGIPQSYRQEVLLRNLARPLDEQGIKGRLEGLRITLGEAYGLVPGPLKWLRGYPISLPLSGVPSLQPSWGEHSGDYVGIKGKWVVFEDHGLKALNLSDFPGRFVARRVA